MTTKANDPIHAMPKMAFPSELEGKVIQLHETYGGLTKREYFAAMAMQGILANLHTFEQGRYTRDGVQVTPRATLLAVDIADMLIEELNK